MNTQTKEQQDDFHRNVDATSKNIERLQETNRVLLEACKACKRLLESGWITPEGKSSDYEDGWEEACAEFKSSATLKQINAAIAKAEGR